tara:strand:- start:507 stop:686 length:180 start_codon:yes stop_codon:yes gene_type:complete
LLNYALTILDFRKLICEFAAWRKENPLTICFIGEKAEIGRRAANLERREFLFGSVANHQ